MHDSIQRVCLYHVFQPRIQASLNRAREAWNNHQIRTEKNKTPIALFELSRVNAIRENRWTGDPGDSIADASDPLYGVDGKGPHPPAEETVQEPGAVGDDWPLDEQSERDFGVRVNADVELQEGLHFLQGFDLEKEDENNGIDIYCEAVLYFSHKLQENRT